MKLYIISGLGADFSILERIQFPEHLEPVFIPWLMPEKDEDFHHYVDRMAEPIDTTEEFCLLGYSFGGFIVQEIHKKIPAKTIVILGSIKSDKEMPMVGKTARFTKIPHLMPASFFSEKSVIVYSFIRKFIEADSPKVDKYFNVRDPYYLKWSLEKIVDWKFDELPDVIQVMGDKDLAFPIKNSNPDFVIKNATHLFPATKYREVSEILKKVF